MGCCLGLLVIGCEWVDIGLGLSLLNPGFPFQQAGVALRVRKGGKFSKLNTKTSWKKLEMDTISRLLTYWRKMVVDNLFLNCGDYVSK